jgi:hypothetical protein
MRGYQIPAYGYKPLSNEDIKKIYSHQYMKINTAAALYGCTRDYITQQRNAGNLKWIMSEGKIYIETDDFIRFATEKKRQFLTKAERIKLPILD